MNILFVKVSFSGNASASLNVAQLLVEKLTTAGTTITHRDLAESPLPHISRPTVGAAYTPSDLRTPEQRQLLALSDTCVDELLAADTLVIATPLWNFSTPSSLKAWIDHIVRVGRTFT